MSRAALTLSILAASSIVATAGAFAQDEEPEEPKPTRAVVRLRESASQRGTSGEPHGAFTLNVSVENVETKEVEDFSVDIGDLDLTVPLKRGRFNGRLRVGDLDLQGSVTATKKHVRARLRGTFTGAGGSAFGARAFEACSERSAWDGTFFGLEEAAVSVGAVRHALAVGIAGRSDRTRRGEERFDAENDDQYAVSLNATGRSAAPGRGQVVVQLVPKRAEDRWDGRLRGHAFLLNAADARLRVALDGGAPALLVPFDSEALDLSAVIRRGEGVVSREIAGVIATQLRFDTGVQSTPGPHEATVSASGNGLRAAQASRRFDAPPIDAPLLIGVDAHALEVRADGLVRGWGENDLGAVGDGMFQQNPLSPVPLAGPTSVRSVGAGEFLSLAVDGLGGTWLWGAYDDDTPPFDAKPSLFGGVPPLTAVAAGSMHGLGLDAAGGVWAFGRNANGQLGDGRIRDRMRDPDLVAGLPPIVAVAAGAETSLALDEDGVVWTWGAQNLRQIGDGRTPVMVRHLPEAVAIGARRRGASPSSTALASDGTVWTWGVPGGSDLPVRIEGLKQVVAISSGGDHDLALTEDGEVWAWGRNYAGQLGNGLRADSDVPVRVAGLTGIVRIAAGFRVSFAVDASGATWIFGDTTEFLGDWGTRTLPVIAPREFVPGNYALDGSLVDVGPK